MLDGRSVSERMTASPRKMCVPGVQARATAGVSISASNTASATAPPDTARGEARITVPRLNPDPLALPANRFPQIVELVFHDIVDRIAGGVDVLANLIHHRVNGDSIHQLFSTFDGAIEAPSRPRRSPPRPFGGTTSRPPRGFASTPS